MLLRQQNRERVQKQASRPHLTPEALSDVLNQTAEGIETGFKSFASPLNVDEVPPEQRAPEGNLFGQLLGSAFSPEFASRVGPVLGVFIGPKLARRLADKSAKDTDFFTRLDAAAREEDLATASVLERQGQNAEEIFSSTGWFRGEDGKWRTEISDVGARFKRPPHLSREAKDIVAHPRPELLEALENLFVVSASLKGVRGQHQKIINQRREQVGGQITLNEDLKSEEEALGTFLHELQHHIQSIEGFAGGSSPQAVLRGAGGKARTIEFFKNILESYDNFARQIASEAEMSIRQAKDFINRERSAQRFVFEDAAFNTYQNVPGEREAREVQRRFLSEQARRQAPSPVAAR